MTVSELTVNELNEALEMVNNKRGYKLIWNREPERKGNRLHFTIRSEKSKISGASYSASGRASVSASWHAHGYLFDAILSINPKAVIKSLDKTIDINGGNWQEITQGSYANPSYASQNSIL